VALFPVRLFRWLCGRFFQKSGASAGGLSRAQHSAASLLAQVHTKLLAQWRNLQDAKQGTFKHWLYRCPAQRPSRRCLQAPACRPPESRLGYPGVLLRALQCSGRPTMTGMSSSTARGATVASLQSCARARAGWRRACCRGRTLRSRS